MYIEFVTDLSKRGRIVELSTLPNLVQMTEGEGYRSLWTFGQEVIDWMKENGTIAGFDGIINFDNILLDIDNKSNDTIMSDVNEVLSILDSYEIPEKSYNIYFSGRGFHITLHPSLFNIEPSSKANKDISNIVTATFPHIDNIYDHNRIIRLENTLNNKSGLYKIQITREEFDESSIYDIMDLAKERRYLNKNLLAYKQVFRAVEKKEAKKNRNTTKQRVNKYNCILNILSTDPKSGERHNTGLRIASHFKRQGYPMQTAIGVIKDWIDDPKEHKDIEKYVREVYEDWSSYFSCKDPILEGYCDKSCIFYNDTNIQTIEDMYLEYEKKVNGETVSLNLKEVFNITEDYVIEGGSLTTLLGATGVGKSTFIQNLVAYTNLNTLYMSLEMPPHQVYGRFTKILQSEDPKVLNIKLNHVSMATKAVYPNELSKIIESTGCKLLIIDHIALMKSQHRDEYAKIMELTGELKQIALEYNVIIVGVSQVARESAKTAIGLFSGKGSGAIENDSDNVIVYDREHNNSKHVHLYSVKNREGYKLDTILQLDNLRLY